MIQWGPLNGITDNGISRLMESYLSWLTNPKLFFHSKLRLKLICLLSYCNL
jgi:hypothetical protein